MNLNRTISHVAVFVLGFAICAFIFHLYGPVTSKQTVMQALSHMPEIKVGDNPVADAAAKVSPAVVSIDTTGRTEISPFDVPFGFFQIPQEVVPRGRGSG